jgi:hypothetical protein
MLLLGYCLGLELYFFSFVMALYISASDGSLQSFGKSDAAGGMSGGFVGTGLFSDS